MVRVLLAVVWMWLLFAPPAWAANVNVRWCFSVDVNYVDAAGGDHWTSNTAHKAARGFAFAILQPGVGVIDDGNLVESGTNAGCTPVETLNTAVTYTAYVYPEGTMGTNTFEHLDSTTAGFLHAPNGTAREDLVIASMPAENYSQLVVAAWALSLHDAGLSAEHFQLDDDASGGCCYTTNGVAGTISHFNTTYARKYIIAHEIGHQVALKWSGGMIRDTTASDGGCVGSPGSNLLKKTWQSDAIVEGIAHFYSAATWNDADGDCDWRSPVGTDFDLTGGTEIVPYGKVDCRDDPDPPDPWDNTDGEDWLSDMLTAVPTVCTGGMTHMSTLYDWLRYLWRMHDVQGLTVEDVFQIWADSHPETWDPNNSTALVLDDPWFRWDGAASSSFPTEHAAEEGAVDH